MEYQQLTIESPAEWEEILTALLFAHGAPGVEVDDPALIAAHLAAGDWDASVFDGQQLAAGRLVLRALFPAGLPLAALHADITACCPEHKNLLQISATPLPYTDWQRVWRESFPALPLGHRLIIMPHWRKEAVAPGQTVLYISPGLAFGTGDHATTALTAELLEHYLQPGQNVLDLGCGSGILAIAALKLGAKQALAVDIDKTCAASVAEHGALNNIGGDNLRFICGDALHDAAAQTACRDFGADIMLANIVAGVIMELAEPAAFMMSPGGLWISSGIICEKEAEVRAAFDDWGWQVLERRERDGWLAFCCCRLPC